MSVEQFSPIPNSWEQEPARRAGYPVDVKAEFEGTVVNEMSHEIQHKYFPTLFGLDDSSRIDEPFRSFVSEVPGLVFHHNAQAAEFLSDVASWLAGSKYFRFFNPLYYMSEHANFSRGKDDPYWYSYQVQKYAMEQVLRKKGVKNPKKIVHGLIEEANNSNHTNHHQLFIMARKYFLEDDFTKIGVIYGRIGVELLKKMKPYFKETEKNHQ